MGAEESCYFRGYIFKKDEQILFKGVVEYLNGESIFGIFDHDGFQMGSTMYYDEHMNRSFMKWDDQFMTNGKVDVEAIKDREDARVPTTQEQFWAEMNAK